MNTFLFIDGSYYLFYRYHSLLKWWKNAHPDEDLKDPYENEIFREKFKKLFIEQLQQIAKKLHIDNFSLIIGRDCKRENIWRNKLFSKYKATRTTNETIGHFFKLIYDEEFFIKAGASQILYHPQLEADDCIAIFTKHLVKKYPDCKIYIITSDHDYLQLSSKQVSLYNLLYKNLAEKGLGNSENDLKMKILMGDVSDNIPSVFPKCGSKTAQKCIENADFLKSKMKPEFYIQYELNKTLIDFDCIPNELVEEFLTINILP